MCLMKIRLAEKLRSLIFNIGLLLSCISFLTCQVAIAQNFQNPSLESWADPSVCEFNTVPDDWLSYSTEGIDVDEGNLAVCPSTIPPIAADGEAYCRAYAESAMAGEGVFQNVSDFIIGNEYEISFDFAGSNVLPGDNDVSWHIFIEDIDVGQTPVISSAESNWANHTHSFTASNTTHKIGFRAFTNGGSGSGSAAIDNFHIEDITPDVLTPPIASYVQSANAVCVGECIEFTNTSEITDTVEWTFEGGDPAVSTEMDEVLVCYDTPGIYAVQLVATNDDGEDVLLVESAVEVSGFPTGELIQQGDSLILISGSSLDNVVWIWNGTTLDNFSFIISPLEAGTYQAILVSESLCNTTLEFDVSAPEVDEEPIPQEVWIPNAMTLDQDGINEAWAVFGNRDQWVQFSAAVFDRWGEKIFESNDPDSSWNGNAFYGGHYVPNGIYVYNVSIMFEGDVEIHNFRGHISVIR